MLIGGITLDVHEITRMVRLLTVLADISYVQHGAIFTDAEPGA